MTTVLLIGVLMAAAVPAAAQRPLTQTDLADAELRTVLRAFYFNLAHQDWEALAADILSAKVVAHRPAPEAMVAAAFRSAPAAGKESACPSNAAPLVDQAAITLDGDWAEVSVPRCGVTAGAADEFRLIRFEERWRVVYIDLFREPESGAVQLAR
ncbi:MAG: hypothetical protein ACREOC_11740 [Gemmatimonadales bacterium]